MKTLQPLILTAHIPDADLKPFNDLRQAHFPPERNFLQAHLTMFHRLPGEFLERVGQRLRRWQRKQDPSPLTWLASAILAPASPSPLPAQSFNMFMLS